MQIQILLKIVLGDCRINSCHVRVSKSTRQASLKCEHFFGQEPTTQQKGALLTLVDYIKMIMNNILYWIIWIVKPKMHSTNIWHIWHMTTWIASFKLKHGANTITYLYIMNHQNNSKHIKRTSQKDGDEMTWGFGFTFSFAKVRQENGQGGTLCLQETAMPRAKREHDQMMPQRFNRFFRSTATNHTQARQQARGDAIMMRYGIQNLGFLRCEDSGFMFRGWKKWLLTLGDITIYLYFHAATS